MAMMHQNDAAAMCSKQAEGYLVWHEVPLTDDEQTLGCQDFCSYSPTDSSRFGHDCPGDGIQTPKEKWQRGSSNASTADVLPEADSDSTPGSMVQDEAHVFHSVLGAPACGILADAYALGFAAAGLRAAAPAPHRVAALQPPQQEQAPAKAPSPAAAAAGGKQSKKRCEHLSWTEGVVTVMVRHIPRQCTQHSFLVEMVRHGFEGLFDFLYLPSDRTKGNSVGYCFINFMDPSYAARFRCEMDGVYLDDLMRMRGKPLSIHPASKQGYAANYESFLETKIGQDRTSGPLFCPGGIFLEAVSSHADTTNIYGLPQPGDGGAIMSWRGAGLHDDAGVPAPLCQPYMLLPVEHEVKQADGVWDCTYGSGGSASLNAGSLGSCHVIAVEPTMPYYELSHAVQAMQASATVGAEVQRACYEPGLPTDESDAAVQRLQAAAAAGDAAAEAALRSWGHSLTAPR